MTINESPLLFPYAAPKMDATESVPAQSVGDTEATAKTSAPAWKVLVIDDEEEVHSVTGLVLADFEFEGRPLQFLHAYSAAEAMALFDRHDDIAVALVDVVMETDDAGLRFIRHVRESRGNAFVRLILRTGQPGIAPEREVIIQYDINDYKAKAELSSLKLFSAMMTALRSYRDIIALHLAHCGMANLLEAATAMFRARSIPRFAEVALDKLLLLLDIERDDGGLYATDAGQPGSTILFASGKFAHLAGQVLLKVEPCIAALMDAADDRIIEDGVVVIYLRSRYGDEHRLFARLDRPATALDRSLAELFRLKATMALDNLLLQDKNQAAQRYAIRMLARLAEAQRYPGHGEPRHGYDGASGILREAREFVSHGTTPQGVDLGEFLMQLAIQAEAPEWGEEETVRHIRRIGLYAIRLAELYGMQRDFCEAIGHAAKFHDVGKIVVAPFAAARWYESARDQSPEAREHAIWGSNLLRGWEGHGTTLVMQLAAQIARHHHEAWNGSGYPDGLAGENIPIAARIVAIADFFDTCTHPVMEWDRPAFGEDETFEMIRAAASHYFDPALARLFVGNRRDFVALRDQTDAKDATLP